MCKKKQQHISAGESFEMTHRRPSNVTRPPSDVLRWLYRLDSFTQTTFGQARTLAAIRDECVACGCKTTQPDDAGLCPRCVALRTADDTAIVLFRKPGKRTTGERSGA